MIKSPMSIAAQKGGTETVRKLMFAESPLDDELKTDPMFRESRSVAVAASRVLCSWRWRVAASLLMLAVLAIAGPFVYGLFEIFVRSCSLILLIVAGCCVVLNLVVIGKSFEKYKKARGDFDHATTQCAAMYLKLIARVRNQRKEGIRLLEEELKECEDEFSRLTTEQSGESDEWRSVEQTLEDQKKADLDELDRQEAELVAQINEEMRKRDRQESAERERKRSSEAQHKAQVEAEGKFSSELSVLEKMIDSLDAMFVGIANNVKTIVEN